jgi:hypothetical protein
MDLATTLNNINWLSVLISAVSAFFLGGIWYGPMFGKAWMEAFGFTEPELNKRHLPKVFGVSLILAFIAALILEMFIGSQANWMYGGMAGFFAGFGWVATMLGILYLFENRSLKAYFINAGYCTLALTLMGLILGAW